MSGEFVPPLLLAILVAILGCCVLLWRLERRSALVESRLSALDRLNELGAQVEKLAKSHSELDLRRVEHVLIDIRDGQRRVEDRLLGALEAQNGRPASASALEPVHMALQSTLPERIVTRLLALGYDRIQFVTPVTDVQKLSAGDGEVAVEARRDGAACKGRVLVRNGAIADLQLQSAYSIFP